MSLRNVFGFFGSGERQTLDRVVSLLDLSVESSKHLLLLVQHLKKYEYDAVDNEYATIEDLDRRTEEEHRSLVRVLCTGSFFGGIREDLLSLLELIDNISDATKHSSAIFHDRRVPKEVIDYFFEGDVESFLTDCVEATELLKDGIRSLEKNKNEVLSVAEKVEEKEEEADTIHHAIIRHLYKNEINAKSLDIVMLKDFLHMADDIADNSEKGSDILLILVAKGYT